MMKIVMNFNFICTEVSKTSVFFVCFVLKFNKIGEVYAIGGCSSAHRQLEITETAFYGGWFYYAVSDLYTDERNCRQWMTAGKMAGRFFTGRCNCD